MLAVALAASAFAQTPTAFGWERGQAVPASAIVKQSESDGMLKEGFVRPVAGFEKMAIIYTDKLGVCAVVGLDSVPPIPAADTDTAAATWAAHDAADTWAARVATKFNGVAATDVAEEDDGEMYRWLGLEGYDTVTVAAFVIQGDVKLAVTFSFDNWDACQAASKTWWWPF